MTEYFSPSFILILATTIGGHIATLAVMRYKNDAQGKEIDALKQAQKQAEADRNEIEKAMALLQKDVDFASRRWDETSGRIDSALMNRRVEAARSEAKILSHVDLSFASIKEIVRDAIKNYQPSHHGQADA